MFTCDGKEITSDEFVKDLSDKKSEVDDFTLTFGEDALNVVVSKNEANQRSLKKAFIVFFSVNCCEDMFKKHPFLFISTIKRYFTGLGFKFNITTNKRKINTIERLFLKFIVFPLCDFRINNFGFPSK